LGWTQADLAEASGISRVTVARIETSATNSEWPTICAIADALGCTTDELREISEKVPA
jgi:transcriptional regulator with XRE-family HTH domain